MLILGLGAAYFNYASTAVAMLSSVYSGYGPTVIDNILGLLKASSAGS